MILLRNKDQHLVLSFNFQGEANARFSPLRTSMRATVFDAFRKQNVMLSNQGRIQAVRLG